MQPARASRDPGHWPPRRDRVRRVMTKGAFSLFDSLARSSRPPSAILVKAERPPPLLRLALPDRPSALGSLVYRIGRRRRRNVAVEAEEVLRVVLVF